MESGFRASNLDQANKRINKLLVIVLALGGIALILSVCLMLQSKIVILQAPGMINDAQIEKSTMDKSSQRAVLVAVTSNLSQINPTNYEYQKNFVQSFFSPEAYTKISKEIDLRVKQLIDQRELGSYYFIFKRYEYDAKLNKHFVVGDVHTVNAAKDTAEPYVFEYDMKIENYRPVIDALKLYKGEIIHNSAWLDNQEANARNR